MNRKHLVLSFSLAVLLCMTVSAFAQTYSFRTVDYPGDSFTQLLGINQSGEIAGYHGATINKGFTYFEGSFTDENYPKSAQTQVTAINTPGKTAGFFISKANKTEGFTDFQGTFVAVEYPKTPFNQLLSQNDFAQAAGYYSTQADGSGPDHAYVYDEVGGVFQLFVIPGSVSAQATGINNSDFVCGFTIDTQNNTHGWLIEGGHYTQLDYPGAIATQALGLNNGGLVVGSFTDAAGNSHGFVYNVDNSTWSSPIDDPNGVGTTLVNGVNDAGVLVGFYGTSPINHGFIATPSK